MKQLLAGLVVASLCAGFVPQQDESEAKKKTDPRFEQIKKLKGEWSPLNKEGKPTDKVLLRYRVTAGGSAVVETIFIGTPKEMVTVYHLDGEKLVLTHYCSAGNQPKMLAAARIEEKSLRFSCAGVSNVKSHDDGHMHGATLSFLKDDRLNHAWTWSQDGKDSKPLTLEFGRLKKKDY